MPSLKAFGRTWNIGSDDFVFPEITEAIVRTVWIIGAVLVYWLHFPLPCNSDEAKNHILALIGINLLTICLALCMAWYSSRGTIMDDRPRRHVSTLLYCRIPTFGLEILWTVLAIRFAFVSSDNTSFCDSLILKITILLESMLVICATVGIFVVFHPSNEENVEDASLIARRTWSRRFFFLKIRQDSMMRSAVDDMATLVASFFTDDLVFSDVAAGLLLIFHSPENVYPPLLPCTDESPTPSWMTVENASHYLQYSSSIYGWATFLHENRCSSWRLLQRLQCCGRLRRDEVLVVEDNCCFCNTAAFLLSTENTNCDLFFISFRNRLCEVPFVVLADHDQRSIVISIRGSLSLADLVTDLCLDDEVFSVDVDADAVLRSDISLDNGEVRVHTGMLRSARYVYDILRKEHILDDMMILYPSYQLVVCGHSLGAGVASLVTLFLKQNYPDVRCFAFCPPGCVISENGQREMRSHVMSIVLGDDVVSRISYQSLFALREKVENVLTGCNLPKYSILMGGIYRLFVSSTWDSARVMPNEEESYSNSLVDEQTHSHVSYGTTSTAIDMRSRREERVQLYPPGKILYVSRARDEKPSEKMWIDPKCLSQIQLSASSLFDHLPKAVASTLEKMGESSRNV